MAHVQQLNPLPLPAVARVAGLMVNRHSPAEISAAIDVLMDLLDFIGGDPEAEHGTWPEDMVAREHDAGHGEDAENDDPAEVDDEPEDDDPKEDEHDSEPEEGTIAHYGMDQSLGPVGPCSDTEPVW